MIFTFNGFSSDSFGILATHNIPLMPTRRKNVMEVPGLDGVIDFGGNSYEPRIITVDCMLKKTSREALTASLLSIAAWLSGSGYLIFSTAPTLRWKAKVYAQIDISRTLRTGVFSIQFECNPPFAEDLNANTGTIGTAQDYGTQVPFYPVITVTMGGSTTSLQVTLASTGEYVKITDSLVSGDVVVFDMAYGTVKKNGVLCTRLIGTTFFGVPTGTQTITVTTTAAHTASMSYRRRYLYAK